MPASNKSSTVLTRVAGAGGGTLLVLLAKNLPDDNPYKSWLVICAPSVSVVVGGILFWLKTVLNAYLKKRDLDSAMKDAKKTLEAALANSATTEAHKQALREDLEKLEKLAVDIHLKKVQALAK